MLHFSGNKGIDRNELFVILLVMHSQIKAKDVC